MSRDIESIELSTIYEISKVLGSSLDLHKTLREVLNLLSSHLQMHRSMASLLQDGQLRVEAAVGLSDEAIERGHFLIGEGVTGRILQTCVPAVIPDISQEPLFLNRTGSRTLKGQKIAFIGVPIKTGRQCIGVLSVDREGSRTGGSLNKDVRFLAMVANLIGQTVRLHQNVAAEREQLLQEKFRLQKELRGKYSLDNVIGTSKRMQQVFADVHLAAPGKATILLRGESGTGKEAIASAIHYLSARKEGPFIKLNCAALPESLLESELFGHEKGAFTGATHERKGRFEQAHGGTLFLDEIGDISPAFQAKLLRVLQEREFERVGGNRTIKVDVRLITATNRNLEEMVKKEEFRADLYYRINVVSIFLPPLRERRDDIPALAEHFLEKFNRENKRRLSISPEAMQSMTQCGWPGNVRELENCIERVATMTRSNVLRHADLPCQKGLCFSAALGNYARTHTAIPTVANVPSAPPPSATESDFTPAETPLDNESLSERDQLIQAMEKCGWVQAKAARLLNLTPRQMGYALKKHDIPLKRL